MTSISGIVYGVDGGAEHSLAISVVEFDSQRDGLSVNLELDDLCQHGAVIRDIKTSSGGGNRRALGLNVNCCY